MASKDGPAKKSIFKNLKDAKVSVDANYERVGHYFMLINKCKTDTTRKNRPFCAIEKTCVHVFDDNDGLGHRPGEDLSHLIMMDSDMAGGEIKKFIGSVLDMDPDEVDADNADMIFEGDEDKGNHDQPFAGVVVECKNRNVKTKSDTDFTRINYMRAVPASELLEVLDAKIIERYFPGNVLNDLAAAEAA